ncbi:unnamed protein product [Vitrella brassicaformis CCMP3155]|uniref:Uncharacterized protein n=1 Tax=Vitrella brassicaformis (strain CCMP3155) TaxID=1169540 RepID=A0A0G4EIS4_VITBC|nr:unnamed protein product [Vitrella brassicaformis CCMP3155]|eukprot:CEL95920.1 unnamed protein product [Vitrella brassicaformis CCMP3155]
MAKVRDRGNPLELFGFKVVPAGWLLGIILWSIALFSRAWFYRAYYVITPNNIILTMSLTHVNIDIPDCWDKNIRDYRMKYLRPICKSRFIGDHAISDVRDIISGANSQLMSVFVLIGIGGPNMGQAVGLFSQLHYMGIGMYYAAGVSAVCILAATFFLARVKAKMRQGRGKTYLIVSIILTALPPLLLGGMVAGYFLCAYRMEDLFVAGGAVMTFMSNEGFGLGVGWSWGVAVAGTVCLFVPVLGMLCVVQDVQQYDVESESDEDDEYREGLLPPGPPYRGTYAAPVQYGGQPVTYVVRPVQH